MIGHQDIHRSREKVLRHSTQREFSGGWNVIDSQLNLNPKFSPVLRNFVLGEDGTLKTRYGTKLFGSVPDPVVNFEYFNGQLIVVTTNGFVYSVNGQGVTSLIWNPEIAFALPNHPNGWSVNLTFACFAKFKGGLIICNGVDKPLFISRGNVVDYLQDLGTLTNINTPICKYVISANDFVVMAGDPTDVSLVHIASQGTSGTWFGDPAPNNAVQINLGGRITQGEPSIRGLAAFRDRVIVGFDEGIVIGRLGVFNDDGDHTPEFDDTIQEIGIEAHRSIQSVGDDVLFCDQTGVPSLNRTVLTETIRPDRASQLIDPEIQLEIQSLTSIPAIHDFIFSVYSRFEGLYILFIPQENTLTATREFRGFAFKSIPSLKVNAWSEFRGWNWRAAARSSEGIVFFAEANRIYEYGRLQEPHARDHINHQEPFTDETSFTDNTGWGPISSEENSGLPIKAVWEMPWGDFGDRSSIKLLKYIAIEAQGKAKFTVQLFVDGIYEDMSDVGAYWNDKSLFSDGLGWKREEPILLPQLEFEVSGAQAGGLGVSDFGSSPFGSMVLGDDARLFATPAKFKIAKLRVVCDSRHALNIVSVTWFYTMGGIRRG